MSSLVRGLHHVTAIAASAQRNFDFYTNILGLRFVKKTVNFDDPHTYHLYYGNAHAEPGSILTFFPWAGLPRGRRGVGQATEIMFAVPETALPFWIEHFEKLNVTYNKPTRRFDEEYITFFDPDGLKLQLVATRNDTRTPAPHPAVPESAAIFGFYGVALTVTTSEQTVRLLTEVLDYDVSLQHVNTLRLASRLSSTAAVVDVVAVPDEHHALNGAGTVHHVAFRVANDTDEMALREQLVERGLNVTPQIDRNYFHSLYFREPGGILFEIATDNPGFTVDEPMDALGTALKLPAQYESRRAEIEAVLPHLSTTAAQ
jgi:glyoxalase family protein